MAKPTEEDLCAVCLEGNIDDRSTTDVCDHSFCFSCLDEWSKVKSCCPLCKREFSLIIHDVKRDMIAYSVFCPTFSLHCRKPDIIRWINNINANFLRVDSTRSKAVRLFNSFNVLKDRLKKITNADSNNSNYSDYLENLNDQMRGMGITITDMMTSFNKMRATQESIKHECNNIFRLLFGGGIQPDQTTDISIEQTIVYLERMDEWTRTNSDMFISGIEEDLSSMTPKQMHLSTAVASLEEMLSHPSK